MDNNNPVVPANNDKPVNEPNLPPIASLGQNKPSGAFTTLRVGFDTHDAKVILWHLLIAALQAILIQLGKENFGTATPTVALIVQVLSEVIRRLIA